MDEMKRAELFTSIQISSNIDPVFGKMDFTKLPTQINPVIRKQCPGCSRNKTLTKFHDNCDMLKLVLLIL